MGSLSSLTSIINQYGLAAVLGGGGAGGPGAPIGSPLGLTATGGIISDYFDGSTVYRAHIFTSSGTFNVSAIGDYPADVEYLIVAGGGGGGGWQGGGGGAGGLRTNLSGHPRAHPAFPVTVSSYPVVVGGGGIGGYHPGGVRGSSGTSSSFGPITVRYGGGGGTYSPTGDGDAPGLPGGSGGGSGGSENTATPGGAGNLDGENPVVGYAGAPHNPSYSSSANAGWTTGGGGGAGGAASVAPPTGSSPGGIGVQVLIAGPPADPQPVGAPGPGGGTGWFAGGGGGNAGGTRSSYGPAPGGGPGGPFAGGGSGGLSPTPKPGGHGEYSTGGGGGGSYDASGGNGGSGIVVVRYQIGQLTAAQKATGGSISYYNGKTIHTFTSSGDFTVTTGPLNVEYVVVAGGGGGGIDFGGAGGAGGYRKNNAFDFTVNPGPNPVTIGAGGLGAGPHSIPRAPGSGSPSVFSTIISQGGGAGGHGSSVQPLRPYQNGGSGGGQGGIRTTDSPAGLGNRVTDSATPAPSQGNNGGPNGGSGQPGGGGGGGGAGGAGGTGNPGPAAGGIGLQAPPTFRDPAVAPSNTTTPYIPERGGGLGTPGPGGSYYLAGGGGGGGYDGYSVPGGPGGAGGGGHGVSATSGGAATIAGSGLVNTGGGGGGSYYIAGYGGSGIVLIAYPS